MDIVTSHEPSGRSPKNAIATCCRNANARNSGQMRAIRLTKYSRSVTAPCAKRS